MGIAQHPVKLVGNPAQLFERVITVKGKGPGAVKVGLGAVAGPLGRGKGSLDGTGHARAFRDVEFLPDDGIDRTEGEVDFTVSILGL
jgi:hypothetical protein